ncbi:hypothetical protein [Allonocardiopsis opalescens]|uniref:Uncharacterized protein n=1 Tax=Allonocardiopsis opalescens TaxID=1144618 RepID=A0A2T0QCD2_9ACTN|nr:hypothetical protein [Allonocardiopsis opalescens]PRY01558.1 hypothetical protein CLV72_101141 [Allonocardiopsis opalescens]
MIGTAVLAFIAGFWVGNGLPYYTAGSTGEGASPSPFPKLPAVNVAIGCAMIAVGAVVWSFADVAAHPVAAYSAGLLGALAVGLIHARLWRRDPWGRRGRRAAEAAGTAG